MPCDFHAANVVLGLHCDGTNGSTTFTDSSISAKAVTANGNAQISTAQSKFPGGASAYFDGTGDYLSVASSGDFGFGTGDFTIECWIYPTAYPQSWAGSYYCGVVSKDASADRGYSLNVSGNGAFSAIDFSGWSTNSVNQSVSASLSGQIQLNTWTHLAVSRFGNTLGLFVNGSLVNSGAFTAAIRDSATTFKIGAAEFDATYKGYFTGYIDDLRITKGVARYTANFTPPTEAFTSTQCAISGVVGSPGNYLERLVRAYRRDTGALIGQAVSNPTTGAYSIPTSHIDECFALVHDGAVGDPYFSNVVLGLHCDGTNGSTTFTDVTGKIVTPAGNAQISTAQSKFGGASAYLDGSGDYLLVSSSSDFAFGTGDFTVEFWMYCSAFSACNLIDIRPVGGGNGAYGAIYLPNATEIRYYSGADIISATHGFATSTWHHVALCRSSGATKLYLNGVQGGSTYTDNTSYLAAPIVVGASAHTLTDAFYNGYIDDLRITKGVARYTANFTPPTAAFQGGLSGGDNAVIYDRIIPL